MLMFRLGPKSSSLSPLHLDENVLLLLDDLEVWSLKKSFNFSRKSIRTIFFHPDQKSLSKCFQAFLINCRDGNFCGWHLRCGWMQSDPHRWKLFLTDNLKGSFFVSVTVLLARLWFVFLRLASSSLVWFQKQPVMFWKSMQLQLMKCLYTQNWLC